MRKIIELKIEWDKSPKKISVNDMYLNNKWKWKWRILHPLAKAYKNYLVQEIKQKMTRTKTELFNWMIYYEIALELWVSSKRKNKIEKWLNVKDVDWLIKLPQDAFTWYLIHDDDQVATFLPHPTKFFVWEWFKLQLKVYEFNLEDFQKKLELD